MSRLSLICENDVCSLVPQNNIEIKITDVYDGDTFTFVHLFHNIPISLNLRLFGVNAPERRNQVASKETSLEKQAGILVGNHVRSLICNKILKCSITDWDKYGGRVLGTIEFQHDGNTMDLSEYLISKRFVKRYDGKKKDSYTDEELRYIIEHCK